MKKWLASVLLIFSTLALPARGEGVRSAREFVQLGIEAFKEGRITNSVEEFESAARVAPPVKAQLWQLGISYYYAGAFQKGRELFELHQTVNPQDVENAIWHFLCVAKLEGVESARKHLMPITEDVRVPMKELQELYAGKSSKDAVLRAAVAGTASAAEKKDRLFYAHFYLGLYNEALAERAEALKEMQLAAGEFSQRHYMGEVARIHLKLRSAGQ